MSINILLKQLDKLKAQKKTTSWQEIARKEQRMPENNWFIWLILAGRGWGKTRTGAESIKELIESGKYKRICLLGETIDQVKSVMIEGESGLLSVYQKEKNKPIYKPQNKQLTWSNGAVATFYSADNFEALRGPQFDAAWIDEFAKFKYAQEAWDQLMFCLRLGENPKVIITTTPRSQNALMQIINRTDVVLTNGSTFENKENLSEVFIEKIQQEYQNELGEQEIFGKLITTGNMLWNYGHFFYKKESEYDYVIISIDPAVTANENSNETGIVVLGKKNDQFFVIDDFSGIYKFEIWCEIVRQIFQEYKANKVIIESNQGGDVIPSVLENQYHLPIETVKAKENKYIRAQNIFPLYQKRQVFHEKKFSELEKQLVNAHLSYKDDRMDALVWGLNYLKEINLKKNEENSEQLQFCF